MTFISPVMLLMSSGCSKNRAPPFAVTKEMMQQARSEKPKATKFIPRQDSFSAEGDEDLPETDEEEAPKPAKKSSL
jgi:hypothetical protein